MPALLTGREEATRHSVRWGGGSRSRAQGGSRRRGCALDSRVLGGRGNGGFPGVASGVAVRAGAGTPAGLPGFRGTQLAIAPGGLLCVVADAGTQAGLPGGPGVHSSPARRRPRCPAHLERARQRLAWWLEGRVAAPPPLSQWPRPLQHCLGHVTQAVMCQDAGLAVFFGCTAWPATPCRLC